MHGPCARLRGVKQPSGERVNLRIQGGRFQPSPSLLVNGMDYLARSSLWVSERNGLWVP